MPHILKMPDPQSSPADGDKPRSVAFAVAVTLLMAVKLADYLNTGSEVVVRQRGRNVAIALALGAFAILFYAATIVRMGANVANRPLMMSPLVSAWSVAP